jgi:hypothetical protein
MAIDANGTTIPQAFRISLVRRRMVKIAHAEREYSLVSSDCASIQQLVAMEKLDEGDDQREGYTFSIECDFPAFRILGVPPRPIEGSDFRYPALEIDQNLHFNNLN